MRGDGRRAWGKVKGKGKGKGRGKAKGRVSVRGEGARWSGPS